MPIQVKFDKVYNMKNFINSYFKNLTLAWEGEKIFQKKCPKK